MNADIESSKNELRELDSLLRKPSFQTLEPVNDAVGIYKCLVRLSVVVARDKEKLHGILRDLLFRRYQVNQSLIDLNDAIISARCVVYEFCTAQEGHLPEKLIDNLETLSTLLYTRFVHTATATDITESLNTCQKAVNATPTAHPRRLYRLNNLSICLYARFRYTDNEDDLDASISAGEETLSASQTCDHTRIVCLHNLTVHLLSRFERSAKSDDLERADMLNVEALASAAADHRHRAELLLNQARVAFSRFRRLHFWRELDEAIKTAKEAMKIKVQDDMTMLVGHQSLAVFQLQKFQVSKKPRDLELAHQFASAAVKESNRMKLVHQVARETLLEYYLITFHHTGKISELQSVIDVLEDQIDDMSKGAARQLKREKYTSMLTTKYQHTGDHIDLVFLCYEAIQMLQAESTRAESATKNAESGRKVDALIYLFGELFRLLLVPEYIDVRNSFMTTIHNAFLKYKAEGIPGALTSLLEKTGVLPFRLALYGPCEKKVRESIIGGDINTRLYHIAGTLEQARQKARTANDPVPLTQFRYPMVNQLLAIKPDFDLEEARGAVRQFNKAPETNTGREQLQQGKQYLKHSKELLYHFEERREREYEGLLSILVEAIALSKRAMDCFISGSEEYADALKQYVTTSVRRSYLERSQDSINITLKVLEDILQVSSDDKMSIFIKLNMCQLLRTRFLRFEDLKDLKKASTLVDELVPSITGEIKDRVYGFQRLSIAALVLKSRFQWLGDTEALDRGISYLNLAVKLETWLKQATSPKDVANNNMLLGFMLRLRFRRTGSGQDIQDAAQFGRSALQELERLDAPGELVFEIKNNVSIIYEDLFSWSKKQEDLDKAISLVESADDSLPNINLANMLLKRFGISADPNDLDRAVSLARSTATDKRDLGPHLALELMDRAEVLMAKYRHSLESRYLEEAIQHAESSLAHTKKENPWRAESLLTYVGMLYLKSTIISGNRSVIRGRCIEVYEEAWQNEYGAPFFRVKAAYCAAKFHCQKGDWAPASSLLESAVEYLSEVSPPWLDHRDRQRLLENLAGLAADAAALAIKTGKGAYQALRLLELGRGVIMGSTIDCRSDISHLAELNPELKREFNRLRMELDSAPESVRHYSTFLHNYNEYSKETKAHKTNEHIGIERQRELSRELKSLLITIRAIPGLEDFMNPPNSESLMKMATGGPIVFILCSGAVGVGNAIIVQSTCIEAINLPMLTAAETTKRLKRMKTELLSGPLRTYAARNRSFRDELLWLWRAAVKPVILHIRPGFEHSIPHKKPHMHWIGVGMLSCVPFHAAGDHSPGSTSNTMSHSISSYASTLRALQCVMKTRSRVDSLDRLLTVTMARTPGAEHLPSVENELLSISSAVGKALPIVRFYQPTPNQVLEQLPHHNLIHFACHGISDPVDPFNSRLLLSNPGATYYRNMDHIPGTLSVRDLLTHRSPKADLAYISACSTANIKVATLADESVHIASGFQLAGFRHVVASLWKQKDDVCLEIAANFYRELFCLRKEPKTASNDEWPVAAALHNAVSEVRAQRPEMVLQWASFIHIGS